MNIQVITKKIKISEVEVGDYVWSYDHDTSKKVVREVKTKWEPVITTGNHVVIETDNGNLHTSKDHRMFVVGIGYKAARDILSGEFLLDGDGNSIKVNSVYEELKDDEVYYDLEVDDTHNYFVGDVDVLSHNSATINTCIWTKEIEDILVLKNNRGSEDNRVRKLDYCVQINRLFYSRFLKKQPISLFSPHDVPGLYDAFVSGDNDAFEKLYVSYENNKNIPRKTVNSYDLFMTLLKERIETGRIYIMNIDHVNSHSSFTVPVTMTNLCVSGDTKILTKDGYQKIETLQNQDVTLWNGKEWSVSRVEKTGVDQEVVRVQIGEEEIICTPYHKFYRVNNYYQSRHGKMEEVRANQLKAGDKLIKFDLPVIEGNNDLPNAYAIGFHTGDGSYNRNLPIVDLYGNKKNVVDYLPVKRQYITEHKHRVYLDIPHDTKFMVPDATYTIESRIKWLAGYIDADGHIAKNGKNQSLQFACVNFEFIKKVRLMLQTMGIDSKITHGRDSGYFPLPDGKGGITEYNCNKVWRLLISSNGLYKLCNDHKLNKYLINRPIHNICKPQRNAARFHVVSGVYEMEEKIDTYCFNEPIRHMGMFNGFLAGNCTEITLPTTPIKHIDDEEGEIATCILSAVNLGNISNISDLEPLCDLIVRSLDALIDYQNYPVKAAEKATLRRRSLGVGYIGLAHYLAKNKLKYSDKEAWELVNRTTEAFQYYLLKASNQLAKDHGPCDGFSETKYSKGILPIDTYKKTVDELVSSDLLMDWETLREDIKKYGLRNSTLTAQMPAESSALTSNATNGIEMPRSYFTIKKSKKGTLPVMVPSYTRLKSHYSLLWEQKSNFGYFAIVAAMQKYFDQAISVNWSYNPANYPDNVLPMQEVIKDMLDAYKYGIKTAYYLNTNDMKGEVEEQDEATPQPDNNTSTDNKDDDDLCESCAI